MQHSEDDVVELESPGQRRRAAPDPGSSRKRGPGVPGNLMNAAVGAFLEGAMLEGNFASDMSAVGMPNVNIGLHKLGGGAMGVVYEADDTAVPEEGRLESVFALTYLDKSVSPDAPLSERLTTLFCASLGEAEARAAALDINECAGRVVTAVTGPRSGVSWDVVSGVASERPAAGAPPAWAASYEDAVSESMFVGRFLVIRDTPKDGGVKQRVKTRCAPLATRPTDEPMQHCRLAAEAAAVVSGELLAAVAEATSNAEKVRFERLLGALASERAALERAVEDRIEGEAVLQRAPDASPAASETDAGPQPAADERAAAILRNPAAERLLTFIDKMCANQEWAGKKARTRFHWDCVRLPAHTYGAGCHSVLRPRDVAVKIPVKEEIPMSLFFNEALIGLHVRHPCLMGLRGAGLLRPGVSVEGAPGGAEAACVMNEAAGSVDRLWAAVRRCLLFRTAPTLERSKILSDAKEDLQHVFGYWREDGAAWVMEDPDGPERVAFFRRLILKTTYEWLSGLEALHADGFVHLDVKKDNIFLTVEGAQGANTFSELSRGVLGDFGTARPFGCYFLRGGVGTLRLQAPEFLAASVAVSRSLGGLESSVRGEPAVAGAHSAPADAWAAGIVLFELLTGVQPFNRVMTNQARLGALMELTYGRGVAESSTTGALTYLLALLGDCRGPAPARDAAREAKLNLRRLEAGTRVIDTLISKKKTTLMDKLFSGWRKDTTIDSAEADGAILMFIVDGLLEWSPAERLTAAGALDGLEYTHWWSNELSASERAALRALRARPAAETFSISTQRWIAAVAENTDTRGLIATHAGKAAADSVAALLAPTADAYPLFRGTLALLAAEAAGLASDGTLGAKFAAFCGAAVVAFELAKVGNLNSYLHKHSKRINVVATKMRAMVQYSMSVYGEEELDTNDPFLPVNIETRRELTYRLARIGLETFVEPGESGPEVSAADKKAVLERFSSLINEVVRQLVLRASERDVFRQPDPRDAQRL